MTVPRPNCPGSGKQPKQSEYKKIGNTPIAVKGLCGVCQRWLTLGSAGYLWTHKEAKKP